jgi:hypothetical protein
MGMSGDNKGLIVTILAIIGGIVVLGWALKLFANLFGVLIMVALVVVAEIVVQKMMGRR